MPFRLTILRVCVAWASVSPATMAAPPWIASMDRFHHFILIYPERQALFGISVNTVRAVANCRYNECDQGLLAFRELSGRKCSSVVIEKLAALLGGKFSNTREIFEILGFVVWLPREASRSCRGAAGDAPTRSPP